MGDTAQILSEIRAGFSVLIAEVHAQERSFVDKEVFDRLYGLHDSYTRQNGTRLNQLELRQEELSRFQEQIKNNTETIARLERRMDNAPGRNMQYIAIGISVISVLVLVFQHVKIG